MTSLSKSLKAAGVTGVAALAAVAAIQFSSAGASGVQVSAVPSAVSSIVPALNGPAVSVPDSIKGIFAGTESPSPDPTANLALARPIAARLSGAGASWLVPTATGACFVVDQGSNGIGVTCGTTAQLKAGIVSTIRPADANGQPASTGVQIGVGGPNAGADGSFTKAVSN